MTTHGFTREAKTFAEAAGIELVTFGALSTQLVNFDDYVHSLISSFEGSPVFHSYIDLACTENENYEGADDPGFQRPLDRVVDRYLFLERRNKLSLLGNFGTGKTTFCRKYAYELAKRYLADRTNRIPILINLSDYESKLDIQELITNTLQFRHAIRIDLVLCEELQRMGRFILLLDGFDEMATRVDLDVIRDNLREINKISRIAENKLVLTCRTHFFRDRLQAEVLADFDIVYIPEWGEEELRLYLQKRFGDEWEAQLDKIHDTHNLTELAQTPLFLEMIVETSPKLGEHVQRIQLYQAYTEKWISQQSGRRGARLNAMERRQFVNELAMKMYLDDKASCHYTEFVPLLRQRFEINDAAQMDYLHSDVRNCTFLTRDAGGNYSFRHKSFMEFFVAQRLASEIESDSKDHIRVKLLPLEVARFVADILMARPPSRILREWLKQASDEIIRENVLSLLTRLKVDFSEAKLEEELGANPDAALAVQFIQGDVGAFDALYRRYRSPLLDYVRRFSRNRETADDIVADAFLRLWQRRERLERVTDLPKYLFVMVRNLYFDSLRSSRRSEAMYELTSSEDVDIMHVMSNTVADSMDSALILTEAIGRLSEVEQKVVTGRFIEGKTSEQIARELGVSMSAVSSISHRAIARLREFLKGTARD